MGVRREVWEKNDGEWDYLGCFVSGSWWYEGGSYMEVRDNNI